MRPTLPSIPLSRLVPLLILFVLAALIGRTFTPASASLAEPDLSITDVTLSEGNAGTTSFTFQVTLASPAPVGGTTFDIETLSGTAFPPGDYTTESLVNQVIAEGDSSYTFTVLVNGDTDLESTEAFLVKVTNIANGTLLDPEGLGTIVDDDQPRADLSITKTDLLVAVDAGASTNYFIVVSNGGPSAADGATVGDPIVSGLAKTSIGACTSAGSAVCPTAGGGAGQLNIANLEAGTVAIPTLPNGGSISFSVTADVTAPSGTVINTATVAVPANRTDASQANNSASDSTNVIPKADISLTKTVSDSSPNVGSQVTFTVTVTNAGPSDSDGVTVTDIIPSGYTGVSNNPSTGTYNSGTGVWTIGTLLPGESPTITFTGTVAATGVYTNVAELTTSSTFDPDSTPNSGPGEDDYQSVTVIPNRAVTVNVPAGIQFTLDSVLYTGSQTVQLQPGGYTLSTTSPQSTGVGTQAAFSSWSDAGAISHSITVASAAQTITGVFTTQYQLTTASNPPAGGTVSPATGAFYNSGTVVNVSATANPTYLFSGWTGPVAAPASAATTVTMSAPRSITANFGATTDLAASKSDGVASVNAQATTTYTLTFTNNGPSAANGAKIGDPTAAGLTKTSIGACTANGGASCPAPGAGAGQLSITNLQNSTVLIPTLPSGGSISFTVSVNVTATTGTVTNVATIAVPTGMTDTSAPNNSSSDINTVLPVADLSLTKTVNIPAPSAGSNVIFTVTVSNAGPNGATGVVVKDLLPSGYQFVSAAPSQGGYVSATGIWTVGAIANAGSANLQITAKVLASGNYANVAEVTASAQTDKDSVPNNQNAAEDDQATRSVSAVPFAGLAVTKTNGAASVNPGGSTTYTLTLVNNGPSAANNAKLKDAAAAGLVKISIGACTANGGAVCPALGAGAGELSIANLEAGTVLVPTLPNGGSISFTVTASVMAASGTVTNSFVATPPAGTGGAVVTANETDPVVDTQPPVVTVTGVTHGASYLLGSVPAPGCSTVDAPPGSGVAVNATLSVTGANANGAGAITAKCSNGRDVRGNVAPPVSATYTVTCGPSVSYAGPAGVKLNNILTYTPTVTVTISQNAATCAITNVAITSTSAAPGAIVVDTVLNWKPPTMPSAGLWSFLMKTPNATTGGLFLGTAYRAMDLTANLQVKFLNNRQNFYFRLTGYAPTGVGTAKVAFDISASALVPVP